jgi:hypothetical protein
VGVFGRGLFLFVHKTLTADLFSLKYTNQLSVDFSEVVIEQMQIKRPDLEWRVDDVRNLKLEDCSFDIAIDKASFQFFCKVQMLTITGNFGRNAVRLAMGPS